MLPGYTPLECPVNTNFNFEYQTILDASPGAAKQFVKEENL